MKAKGIVSIVIGSILLLVGIAVICSLMLGFNLEDWKGVGVMDRENFVAIKQETVTEKITRIEANWIDGRLDILPSEDEAVQIVQLGKAGTEENKLFEAALDGSVLRIKDRRGGFLLSLLRAPSDLKLYLPQQQYEAVTLHTVSADIKTGPLSAGRLDISTTSGIIDTTGAATSASFRSVSGDILAGGLSAESAEVSTTSGSLLVEGGISNVTARSVSGNMTLNLKETQNLTAKSTSGRVAASGSFAQVEAGTVSGEIEIASFALPEKVSAGSTSGNITLSLPENSGFSVRFNSTSGSLSSELPMTESQKVYRYGEGGPEFEVKTVSGSLDVKKVH